MAKWLQSGRRRDLCALLYEAGSMRGQRLKTALESHYDTHLEPQSFYGSLDALVSAGFVERRTEGIHDVYELTDAGRLRLEAHYAWLRERMGDGADHDAPTEE
jgi:DNA-binding PadR family transcriptional regulator